ncbi:unnamed protein product [Diabrotica balteata]|uniref:RNA-binding protein fusilli n=1 Tax=Diabrotica balteata TaxID=107213 RepID=A0A9N9XGM0_DIABA|nr:unnamed protein product [Diabrotica balteata]
MWNNNVIAVQQYPVRPQVADINENILSNEVISESGLTDDFIKGSGRQLEEVISSFDLFCNSLHIDPNNSGFRIVTDGQLPLRQCLHPEACRKDLDLPPYYSTFHDLRKEVAKYVGRMDDSPQSVSSMLEYLEMDPDLDQEFYKKEAKDMVNVVQRLISLGHRFDIPENIHITLEPGICSKDDEIDSNCVVRARGLPWQSSDQDIANFFRGLNVAKGGVALCLSAQGRRNGEALVRFVSQEHRDMALKRHKHHIGTRWIEVYRATGTDFLAVAGGSSCEAQAFLSKGAALDFFASGENSCTVLDGVDGVLFVRKPDGRATGDAFVLFASESDSSKALSKHRECIGSRYIELFRSTTAEVQQCSGEDMNLVLTGGIPPVPTKAATALLSPGMLPPIAHLPPTNIPPPPPPQSATATTMSQSLVSHSPHITWDSSALFAQQQAQIIAQHNLMARQNQAQQAQNEMLLMNQIAQQNFALFGQNISPLSPNSAQTTPTGVPVNSVLKTPQHHAMPLMPMVPTHPFMLFPPRMPITLQRPPPMLYQQLVPGQTQVSVVPHVAVKRSYGDAFSDQASPAKRPFAPASLSMYPPFYPNM